MTNKTLDLSKSVYELVQQYPEVVDIMAALGFTEITKKAMLLSVGRMMTIPKGSAMKGIPMERIVKAFEERGFTVSDGTERPMSPHCDKVGAPSSSRVEQLKAYLRRLGEGESLESVRKDFAECFANVDAHEIMDAEQQLMSEGTPLEEVQRLCDVHSALFHGNTGCTNAHSTPEGGNVFTAMMLAGIEGHPLYTFTRENEAIQKAIAEWKQSHSQQVFARLRDVSIHYAKKGDLLYPLLKTNYDISRPQNVMWTVDDEIRDEMGHLVADWDEARAEAVLQRVEEMIFKESNILFPICAEHFSADEWCGIYRDSKDYAACLGVENKEWADGHIEAHSSKVAEGEVVMPGGHLTIEQLTALLNTIPMEISFVDADNINRFFNEGPKVFKRPMMSIDREVFSCHPPKIEPMVRNIINSFRSGQANRVPVWMEKGGRTMLVQYMAVRDNRGQYLGTVELVQDMEFARERFSSTPA